jgi:Holliday junction resolvasome RuvABC endonuclease subunit
MTSEPRVIGLDVSGKTGVALHDGTLLRLTLRTGPDQPGRRFHELAGALEQTLRRYPPVPDLAVYEGPALGGPGVAGKLTSAGYRAVVLLRLFELGVEAVLIEPGALKRYATGNGNASKEAMIEAAVALGAEPRNDDEADAFHLRHLGRAAYGLEDVRTKHGLEVIAAHTWPRIDR